MKSSRWPTVIEFSKSHGQWLCRIEENKVSQKNYGLMNFDFIEYLRRAYEETTETSMKSEMLLGVREQEGFRDFYTGSLRQIKHLIQFDRQPNHELTETKEELYKISVSFPVQVTIEDMVSLKGSDHRVLFQNAAGNINMGVWFNDPDVEMDDIFWYHVLTKAMHNSLALNEGLVSADDKLETMSCYVVLHSHPVGMNGQNHITAVTPMKFLPIKDFEKQQKSIDFKTTVALMNSMMSVKSEIIEKKIKAKELKESGNKLFSKKKYDEAEKCYSEAIDLNIGSRPLWTNRAICRNVMKKHVDAVSDCDSALSINPKCTKTITEKGKALLGLGRFDEARECYESLRTLDGNVAADSLLKKLDDIQFPKQVQVSQKTSKKSKRKQRG